MKINNILRFLIHFLFDCIIIYIYIILIQSYLVYNINYESAQTFLTELSVTEVAGMRPNSLVLPRMDF